MARYRIVQQEEGRRTSSVSRKTKRVLQTVFAGLACLAFVICGVEFWYIKHLQESTRRIPNDDFDVTFFDLDWTSPKIWDETRQSFIRDVAPVAVHSHNDYTRSIPLWEALGSGCISVEADIHLRKSDLLVGHSSRGLKRENSLRSMYLQPLQRLIESRNINITDDTDELKGVFGNVPSQTLILLIDFKTSGQQILDELNRQLEPLRAANFLTYWNGTHRVTGPLTIVASGAIPFSSILALDLLHRDIFYDAPLLTLHNSRDDWTTSPPTYAYNISNSYYASTEIRNGIFFHPSDKSDPLAQQDADSSQLEQARRRGLVSRYWGSIKGKERNYMAVLWRTLITVEVGILNMDDLGMVRDWARGMGGLLIQG